jgi:hypothetical protein
MVERLEEFTRHDTGYIRTNQNVSYRMPVLLLRTTCIQRDLGRMGNLPGTARCPSDV